MRALRPGEEVIGADGRRLGALERLVVDEDGDRVTHVVVHGRLIGVGRLREAGPDRLQVDLDRAALDRLPEAHSELVAEAERHWRPPGGYALDNFLRVANALIGQSPYVPPVQADLDLDLVHEIAPGSPLWSGRTRLGQVESVLTGDEGVVTALVIRPEHRQDRLLLLADRITEVVGVNVHTDLGEDELDGLPAYSA